MKIIDINSIPRGFVQNNIDNKEKKITRTIKLKKRTLYAMILLIIVIPISILAWHFYQAKKELIAQDDIFQSVYHFEAGHFEKALEGDGVNKGLLAVVQQYPYTKTANLARFYIGISYMHQKQYDKTISFLSKFNASDFIVQSRAWCVIGDAYSAQKKYQQAARYYMKAAHYKENSVYSPGYLAKAATAFEADKRYQDAYHCYQTIIAKYPKSRYGSDLAIKEANRLSALL